MSAALTESCNGRPVQAACKTWRNIVLLSTLCLALLAVVAGFNCETIISTYELTEGICPSLLASFTAAHLKYIGGAFLFGFCCCPCFKMDCDTAEIEKRSCFLKAMQRRRRERARHARAAMHAARGGAPGEDGLEGLDLLGRHGGSDLEEEP